jgi:hypothetical protein
LDSTNGHRTDPRRDPALRATLFALAAVLARDAADRTAVGALAPVLEHEFSIGNTEIADGIQQAFLILLPGLALSGVLLLRATRHYPAEVAAVQQSTLESDDDA